MSFVSFSLFHIFILSVCFLFSLVFSPLSLTLFTFSVCVSFSVSSSRSLSWSLSTVSLSYFLTFLILVDSLSSSSDFFSFPLLLFLPSPISSYFSFPLWVILLSPLLPLSRLLSRFSVPFRLSFSFRCFLFVLSPYFSLPHSSPFLSLSLLLPFLPPLLPFGLSSLLFAVFLFEVFLFPPFSPGSLLFPFSLFCFFFGVFFLSALFLTSSASSSLFLFTWRLPFLLPCLRPLSLPSSLFLLLFFPLPFSFLCSFCFFLLFLPLMSPLSVRMPFVLLLAFLPFLLLLVFDPPPLLVLLFFTLTLLSQFCLPVVFFSSSSCLSLLFGSLACFYSLIFFLFHFSPLLLWFSFRWRLSRLFHHLRSNAFYGGGGVPFHKCLSAFCPPLFSDASRDFSSSSSAFSPLFVRLPLLSLFLLCLQLLLLFLQWLRPPPLASLLLSLCLLLSLLPRGSLYLRSPFLRCLNWVVGLYALGSAQALPQAPIGVSSLSTASPLLSVPPPAVPSSSLPAFQPQGSILLPLLSCLRLP